MQFIPLSEDQLRQFIDAETSFAALERARAAAGEIRGSMFWRRDKGKDVLVRATTSARQTRLGPRNEDTEGIFQRFTERKVSLEGRIQTLEQSVERNRRLNLALRVGRCPNLLIRILDRLARHGVADHFLTVGTHALYAYEAAAGVRIIPEALATRDVDVLFDTRKQITFFTQLRTEDLSFIDLLRKADPTFEVMPDQLQTAVNASGFEVDVIRREAGSQDPHPMKMRHREEDLWAVQVSSGGQMPSAPRLSQMVVSTDGSMARMNTIGPVTFAGLKRKLSTAVSRDPRKRSKDALQAEIVQALIDQHLIDHTSRSSGG